jgi:hypothetical protein
MENPIKNLITYFQKEPGHALTFGYITLIVIGMFFDYFYYVAFKINVIQFAELDDLLLAPIQDIRVLLTVFLFCLIAYIIIEWDIWWRKKYPESYVKWSKWGGLKDPFSEKSLRRAYSGFVTIFILYIILGSISYGSIKAKKVKKGQVDKIHLTMKDMPTDSVSNQHKPLFFIGKTKSFVFVYDTAAKKTTIINIGEIQKIEFEK